MTNPDLAAGILLRRARQRREWTQAEMARRAAIPASQLCAYETGAKQPRVATLARILAVAGVDLTARDERAERLRQGEELADALGLVDAMPPPRGGRTFARTFRELVRT